MTALNSAAGSLTGVVVPGDGATFVLTSDDGSALPATLRLTVADHAGVEQTLTPALDGATGTWMLTIAQVSALVGTRTTGSLTARITTGTGDLRRWLKAGRLSILNKWHGIGSPQSLGTVTLGPAGPGVASAAFTGGDLVLTLDDSTTLDPLPLPAIILTETAPGLYAMTGDAFSETDPGMWAAGGVTLPSVDGDTLALPASVVTANQGTTGGTFAAGNHAHAGVYDPAGTASAAVLAHASGTGAHSIAGVTGLQAALDAKLGTETLPATIMDAKGDLIAASAADTPARLAVGASGAALVADSTQTTGLRWMTALTLEGGGSPEGVVSAPTGSTYTDRSVTTGAGVWRKASGSGNTGWVVASGDSGWRSITASLVNGWGASALAIRRTNNLVTLMWDGLTGASATSGVPVVIPDGFRPKALGIPQGRCITAKSDLTLRRAYVDTSHNFTIAAYATSDVLSGYTQWIADSAWPATLPGSAI